MKAEAVLGCLADEPTISAPRLKTSHDFSFRGAGEDDAARQSVNVMLFAPCAVRFRKAALKLVVENHADVQVSIDEPP